MPPFTPTPFRMRWVVLTAVVGWSLACMADDTIDTRHWNGACEGSSAGDISVEAGPFQQREGVEDMTGEHVVYTAAGTLEGGGHAGTEVDLMWIQCLEPDGCWAPAWEYEPDEIAIQFAGPTDRPPVYVYGGVLEDKNRTLTGNCMVDRATEGTFVFDLVKLK